jgi:hypothetical protein
MRAVTGSGLDLFQQHLDEYMRDTCKKLDQLARELRQAPEELPAG